MRCPGQRPGPGGPALLRLGNAAADGRSGHIGTVHDAISLLGRRTVSAVPTAAAVAATVDGAGCRGFDPVAFWREAVAGGIAARTLAAEVGADSGLAFTAGLLHDMDRQVLISQLPEAMAQAMDWARRHGMPMHVAEHEMLGIDHAEAGALVAQRWHFPPVLVAAIPRHHAADGLAGDPVQQWLCDLVQGANTIAHALDLHQAEEEHVTPLSPALWQRLQPTSEGLARVLAVSEQGVSALAGSLAP